MSATESPDELVARLHRERAPLRSTQVGPSRPIAVTGGRDHEPTLAELQAFWFCFDRWGGAALLHGDARGVDRAVAADARRRRPTLMVIAYAADWKKYGRAAGPLRNQALVLACSALIAFPGGVGTANAVASARRLGRPVHRIEDELELLRRDIQKDHVS